MKAPGSITLTAGELQEALTVAVPKRRKSKRRKARWFVTLELDSERSVLEIAEARHALKAYQVTASGTWPVRVQVDGVMFRRIIEKYSSAERIELVATDEELCILATRSMVRINRLDAGGKRGIQPRPIPRDPRHVGPVKVPPDPLRKRVALDDTWLFSARVPMPQHRDPKDK